MNELTQHLLTRPTSPGAVGANHPAYVAYYDALGPWCRDLERLEVKVAMQGVDLGPAVKPSEGSRVVYAPARPVKKAPGCKDCMLPLITTKRQRCHACQVIEDEAQRQKKNIARARVKAEATANGNCRKHPQRKAMNGYTVCIDCIQADRVRTHRRRAA